MTTLHCNKPTPPHERFNDKSAKLTPRSGVGDGKRGLALLRVGFSANAEGVVLGGRETGDAVGRGGQVGDQGAPGPGAGLQTLDGVRRLLRLVRPGLGHAPGQAKSGGLDLFNFWAVDG